MDDEVTYLTLIDQDHFKKLDLIVTLAIDLVEVVDSVVDGQIFFL